MIKLRSSSAPAKALCWQWQSQPFDTQQTSTGTDRHEALEAYFKGDEKPLEALELEDRDGVEWAIDYIKAHSSESWPMEWEKAGKLTVQSDEIDEPITVSGRWDLANGPEMFDLKWRMPTAGKSYDAQCAMYAAMNMARGQQGPITFHVLYGFEKRAEVKQFSLATCDGIINELIESYKKNEATPNPYCGWCGAAAECPAMNKLALKVADSFDREVELFDPNQILEPPHLAKALKFARALKPWMEAIERHAKEAVDSGIELEGFKSQQRTTPRKVTDLAAAFAASGLTNEEFVNCCTLKLTELVKAFAEANGLKQAEAKRQINERLADVFVEGTKYNSLVKS